MTMKKLKKNLEVILEEVQDKAWCKKYCSCPLSGSI